LTQPFSCVKNGATNQLQQEIEMPIPNAISRQLRLPHSPAATWAALSTPDGLAGWFGQKAEGEVVPGSTVIMSWDNGHRTQLDIKVVEPEALFAYCWPIYGVPPEDPRRTYVEFRLEPSDDGTTLTVTESGFAQMPDEWLSRYQGNSEGWGAELGELVAYLAAS